MEITDPLTRKIHIKMSGCPNGCSQHHIANIGFYGASIKVGGRHDARLHPAHRRQLRGRRGRSSARGSSRGCPPSACPRRSSAGCGSTRPSATTARSSTTSPSGSAPSRFEDEVKDLTLPAEFSLETMQQFIDWNRSDPYKVERGEGECAI